MPEAVADLLQRKALAQQALSESAPQRVRPTTLAVTADALQAALRNARRSGGTQGTGRSLEREENLAVAAVRASLV